LLIEPGDAGGAAAAVRRLAEDPALRERLAAAGLERAGQSTLELQARKLADFLSG
jgi:glycosyltransferase involved in cell wall biosynthesis